MMNQDLGLSLSLSFPSDNRDLLQLNLFNSNDQPSNYRRETLSFLKGIDVNRSPATAVVECEEEGGVSSPNSTISSVSGKRSSSDLMGDGQDAERDSSRGNSDEEDGDGSRKKLRLSKDQSVILEESFKEHNTLNPKQKLALAKRLSLRPRQVEVWFQNRRARTKLKQTEVDCEFLKRCCDNLTEENRRLQKEVQELRALKMSPQFYMQMAPPTTLTLCPSCDIGCAASSTASVDPRSQNRAIAFNPWSNVNTSQRTFDVLRPN
ncbi:homeobox-leucine zipper protein HAT4-like [Impatiens glandulifera]|uniref:homeobox-leucine zipper protein HAT4-like n=1 Tax=Impatiens glandulifera TaxID=253017 RepID=UPI001FB0B1D6|nr:homeobox-leucine zipper protein HAT4-like [Impatiens glandulifera]